MRNGSNIFKRNAVSFAMAPALLLCVVLSGYACDSPGGNDNSQSGSKLVLVRQNIPFADPYILLHDNVYYAYGTSSDNGFEVYHSKELKYWRKHTSWLLRKEDSYADRWFWAPEVSYNSNIIFP